MTIDHLIYETALILAASVALIAVANETAT
jgi:hypothetical protein